MITYAWSYCPENTALNDLNGIHFKSDLLKSILVVFVLTPLVYGESLSAIEGP